MTKRKWLFALLLAPIALFGQSSGGALDIERDTFGLCDEQYYAVVTFRADVPIQGRFSVNNDGEQVTFAPGNLQYQPMNRTWRFAQRQWMIVGNRTTGDVYYDSVNPQKTDTIPNVRSNNEFLSSKYSGWIDLFGWGTSGYTMGTDASGVVIDPYCINYAPISTSTLTVNTLYNNYGYGPSFNYTNVPSDHIQTGTDCQYYDWGQYNGIYSVYPVFLKQDGGVYVHHKGATNDTKVHGRIAYDSTWHNPREWRVPTASEIDFIFNHRTVEDGVQKPYTCVSLHYSSTNNALTRNGLLIFPDDFTKAKFNLSASTFTYGSTTFQSISYGEWEELEAAGCCFLPCAGERSGFTVTNPNTYGNYWQANAVSASDAYIMQFNAGSFSYNASGARYMGYSVRLVKDLVEN